MSAAEGRNGKEGSARGRTSGDTDARRARIDATTTAPGAMRSFWLTERAVRVDAPGYAQLASVALAVGHLLHPRKARHGASRCESQVPTTSVSDFAGRSRSPSGSRRLEASGKRAQLALVLARLVRATRRSQCRASTPRGGLKTQAPRNRSRRKTATKRRFVNGHFTRAATSHQKNHDFGVSETSRPRPAGHFPGRASARSTLSNERRRSTDLVTEP